MDKPEYRWTFNGDQWSSVEQDPCGDYVYYSEYKALLAQLPEEMQDCTIQYLKCERGHGRLTATNWINHGCHHCELEFLRKTAKDHAANMRGELVKVTMNLSPAELEGKIHEKLIELGWLPPTAGEKS